MKKNAETIEFNIEKNGKNERWTEMDMSKELKSTVLDSDKNFGSVMDWIKRNFAGKLNCTPEQSKSSTTEPKAVFLILYSTSDASKDPEWR